MSVTEYTEKGKEINIFQNFPVINVCVILDIHVLHTGTKIKLKKQLIILEQLYTYESQSV
jgi:hypothetical protein